MKMICAPDRVPRVLIGPVARIIKTYHPSRGITEEGGILRAVLIRRSLRYGTAQTTGDTGVPGIIIRIIIISVSLSHPYLTLTAGGYGYILCLDCGGLFD